MGQPVTVIEKPTSTPGVIRYEINRTVTGTGHEVYRSIDDAQGDAPSDLLGRVLFGHGGIASVHIYGNVITVHLADGAASTGIREAIENVYIFYKEGVEVAPPA
ncbi:MAG: hypothetical protein HYX32_02645 [Actinobacteria bacterium]|nr:hypothetical protein [Actinomycetota bacterium]